MIDYLLCCAYTLVLLGYVVSPWVMPIGVVAVVFVWRRHFGVEPSGVRLCPRSKPARFREPLRANEESTTSEHDNLWCCSHNPGKFSTPVTSRMRHNVGRRR